jgi:homoserine kinase type II
MEFVDLNELRQLVENLVTSAQVLQEAIDKNYMARRLTGLLAKNYDIGELVEVKKLDRGYVNVSYEIEIEKGKERKKYFLRRYKRGIREDEVKFEHSIIKHLMMKKFHISAGIIPKNDGTTYVKEVENVEDRKEDVYFAIFEFLKGEDKYTWDNPLCNDTELEDSALVLARYHNTVYGLKPEGRRYEPRVIELLPTISGNLMKYAKRTGTTKFDNYFLKNLDPILGVIDSTLGQMDRDEYEKLPRLAVHCDFHPGNLKYLNNRAVGLFDFDWSKVDVRCFDVGLAITYFCTTWEGKDDGDMLLDRMIFFLSSYQKECANLDGIGPLTGKEIEYLPIMVKASNLYVLNWDVDDYYIKKPNPFEYLIYLQHNVRVMRWLESNWENFVYTIYKTLHYQHSLT